MADIRRTVERGAVAWLAAHRTRFDPDTADKGRTLFVRKAFVEVALLVGLRARAEPGSFDGDADYRMLYDQVTAVAARASYRELVARDERALLLYAGTYASQRLCGRRDSEFERLIGRAVAGRYAACFERVPFRQLDLLHTLELAGVDHGMPADSAVLPFSLLCADPSVVKLSDSDIYAVTHTVFYATDFGRRIPRWPTGFGLPQAVELLEALSLLCRQRENADLVAELLCCLLCLGIQDSPEMERAWAFLAGVQEPDGRVAGPEGILPPELENGDAGYRDWATGYHTTIVAALAGHLARDGAVIRQPRPSPPRTAGKGRLEAAIRCATAWLTHAALEAPFDDAVPAAGAAARAARSVGEPQLAARALTSLVQRAGNTLTQPMAWGGQGVDAVAECARGLSACGLVCESLDQFLTDTAAALTGLTAIPTAAAGGVRRLRDLGRLTARQADSSSPPRALRTCSLGTMRPRSLPWPWRSMPTANRFTSATTALPGVPSRSGSQPRCRPPARTIGSKKPPRSCKGWDCSAGPITASPATGSTSCSASSTPPVPSAIRRATTTWSGQRRNASGPRAVSSPSHACTACTTGEHPTAPPLPPRLRSRDSVTRAAPTAEGVAGLDAAGQVLGMVCSEMGGTGPGAGRSGAPHVMAVNDRARLCPGRHCGGAAGGVGHTRAGFRSPWSSPTPDPPGGRRGKGTPTGRPTQLLPAPDHRARPLAAVHLGIRPEGPRAGRRTAAPGAVVLRVVGLVPGAGAAGLDRTLCAGGDPEARLSPARAAGGRKAGSDIGEAVGRGAGAACGGDRDVDRAEQNPRRRVEGQ